MTGLLSSIRDSFYKPQSDAATMPSATPEQGDKVSWGFGGANPSGEVSEKKTEGEAAVTSKRGNTITKSAEPDDPALEISRSGNDAVKKQSEVEVEDKKAKGRGGKKATPTPKKGKKADTNGDAPDTPASKKRALEEDEDEEEEEEEEALPTKKPRGRAAKAKSAPAKKSAPTESKGTGKRGRPPGNAAPKEPKPKVLGPDGKPRGRGRPPGTGAGVKKAANKAKAATMRAAKGAKRGRKSKA